VSLIFAPQAWEDYLYWQKTDPQMISRINLLIKEIMRNPYSGIGKPEPLKPALQGFWSRRVIQSTESFTKKRASRFSSRSCNIIIDKWDVSCAKVRRAKRAAFLPL
jgi:toxin YoeB